MAINRDYIISKIKQAIEQLPSDGLVLRENVNKYNEKISYNKIANLRGVLYSETSNKDITISLQDKGQIFSNTSKYYLIPYEENSTKIIKTDLIFIEDKVYKITDTGENLKMYFLMQVEEVQGLVIQDNFVVENGNIYEITELSNEYTLKFS